MYELIFEKRALRELNKLEKQTRTRIWNKLQDCKKEPFRYLEPLAEIRGFKLRVGNYRVVIDVENKMKILSIIKVEHRSKVYVD